MRRIDVKGRLRYYAPFTMTGLLLDRLAQAGPVFFATFTGLAFETIPFLLIGTTLSSLVHVLVPGEMIRRVFPRNRLLSLMTALVAGAFIPICECGTVPLANSLRRKGLPLSTAAAFLLAAPLVNPMTILSTFAAFQGGPRSVFLYRLCLGLVAAFVIALLIDRRPGVDPEESPAQSRFSDHSDAHAHPPQSLKARVGEILEHTSHDFLDTARYLVLGIFVASLLRVFVPTGSLTALAGRDGAGAAAGLLLAYTLSLCSVADAFVARSLLSALPFSATIAFLLLGPMINIKNTVLLSRFIRPRQLAGLLIMVFTVDFTVAVVAGHFVGGGS